ELHTRGIGRALVRYDDLLEDWTTVADKLWRDLGLTGRLDRRLTKREVEDVLRPGLRHYRFTSDRIDVASPVGEWVTEAHAALDLLAQSDRGSDRAPLEVLDQIRDQFDKIASLFGPVITGELQPLRE